MMLFRREVKLWATLSHEHVVTFHGANHREEPLFIVSSYACRGTLREYLKSESDKGRTVAWRKLKEATAGLSYLHGKRIVHGDLKGDSIVVSEDGSAKLTDFGLSFLDTGPRPEIERLGAMQWRAPEYATQTVRKPSFSSDVYSLGMCIIEAVKGDYPWGHWYESDTIREFLRQGDIPIERPASMNDRQWDLVLRMTAYRRDD